MKSKKNESKVKKPSIAIYLKNYRWQIFLYIFISLIATTIEVFMSILLANAIEQITLSEYNKAITTFLIVIALELTNLICYYFINFIYYKYSNKIMSELNLDLAKQAFKLNSKTFNDHDTGTFVQRIVEDPTRIVDNLASVVDQIMTLIGSLVILIYITTLNIYVSICLLVLMIVGMIIEYFRIKTRRKNRFIVRKENDKINSLTTEIVRSEKDIKSLGLENKLSDVSKENYERYRKARYKFDFTDLTFWVSRAIWIEIGTLATLVLGIVLMQKWMLTIATFMIIYSNRRDLTNTVFGFARMANSFIDIKVSHNRMFSLFDEYEFVTEKFGAKHLTDVSGDIEFQDVCFTFREYEYRYEPVYKGKKKKSKTVKVETSQNKIFDKLSFKIPANSTVAFVGKSGSGKSTILNLISKMYEADEGKVLIGGEDIKDFDKESLRQTISLVNQFPYIFDMTIKENLVLAKANASDDEISDALKKSSLDEFVYSLPKGIETKVGESGIKLSGGQKQRLAIARAMLRKSKITIFDESTSSLDNIAQEHVKRSIDLMKGQSTIIIVAHRLSTIKNVDHIFFLDEGKIIDEGTFDELFNTNEKFKTMFLAENI